MLAHSRPGAGSRQGNGAAKAGAGGRSAPPLQPAPALTRRALVHPVPSPRPTPGLVRQRPQRQRPQELPGATPEQQQQFPGSELDAAAKAEAAAAKLQRYPWHSDEWKEEYRKQVRVVSAPPPAAAAAGALGRGQPQALAAAPSPHGEASEQPGGGRSRASRDSLPVWHYTSRSSSRTTLPHSLCPAASPPHNHRPHHAPPDPVPPSLPADL